MWSSRCRCDRSARRRGSRSSSCPRRPTSAPSTVAASESIVAVGKLRWLSTNGSAGVASYPHSPISAVSCTSLPASRASATPSQAERFATPAPASTASASRCDDSLGEVARAPTPRHVPRRSPARRDRAGAPPRRRATNRARPWPAIGRRVPRRAGRATAPGSRSRAPSRGSSRRSRHCGSRRALRPRSRSPRRTPRPAGHPCRGRPDARPSALRRPRARDAPGCGRGATTAAGRPRPSPRSRSRRAGPPARPTRLRAAAGATQRCPCGPRPVHGAARHRAATARADRPPRMGCRRGRYASFASMDDPAIERVVTAGSPRAAASSRCVNARNDQCSTSTSPRSYARANHGFGVKLGNVSPEYPVITLRTRPPRKKSAPKLDSDNITRVKPGSRSQYCRTTSRVAAVQRVWPTTGCSTSPGRTWRATASLRDVCLSGTGRKLVARAAKDGAERASCVGARVRQRELAPRRVRETTRPTPRAPAPIAASPATSPPVNGSATTSSPPDPARMPSPRTRRPRGR